MTVSFLSYVDEYISMNKATKLWKANLNSDYHAYQKNVNKNTGNVTVRVKYNEDDEWHVLP